MKVFKNILFDFLKGICIGIANVIPGFSGGTMAVILKVYERVIGAFSNITKKPFQTIKDIWAILLGLAAGVLIAAVTIVFLLEIAPLPTMMFFVGLLLGSIPDIFKQYKAKGKFSYYNLLYFLIAVALIVTLPLINTSSKVVTDVDIWQLLIIFLLGTIAAAAMIIPGVSGSMILMIFCYYDFVMTSIKSFFESVLLLDFNNMLSNLYVLIAFGLGCVVGIVLISKLLTFLFNKYSKCTYALILGLLIASPFSMLFSANNEYPNFFSDKWYFYLISLITLAMGLFVTLFLSKLGGENENKDK